MEQREILDIQVGSLQVSSTIYNECRSIPPPRQNTDIYKP